MSKMGNVVVLLSVVLLLAGLRTRELCRGDSARRRPPKQLRQQLVSFLSDMSDEESRLVVICSDRLRLKELTSDCTSTTS
jgi:hypothetical protein